MEVCSSTEMGAPGASHLGTGDHGPKTDRSRPRSVPLNAVAFTYRIHGTGASRIATPLQTLCVTAIVHRNGKTKECVEGTWGLVEILALSEAVMPFATAIEDEIRKLAFPARTIPNEPMEI
jgi:hypothetical protein